MASEDAAPARGTRPARIAGDIGEKLSDLLEFLRANSADYLDPLVRAKIESDYKRYEGPIKAMKTARAAREQGSADPAFANALEVEPR